MKFIGQNADEAKQVFRLLDKLTCEEEVISYSGRGMYGKECLAVVVRPYMVADLFFAMGKFCGEHDIDLPHITHVATDNMGSETVIYWKTYEVESEEQS